MLQRRRNHQSFKLHRIDIDQHPQLVEQFKIDTIPALVVGPEHVGSADRGSVAEC